MVLGFDLHWDANLSVRLRNSEMMAVYPNKSDCTNQILAELINGYQKGAIDTALLSIYEVVKFIRKVDKNFTYDEKDPSDPIGVAIGYRNKLLVHMEENRHKPEGKIFSLRFAGQSTRIYRDIEAAVSKIKEWIDMLLEKEQLGGRVTSAKPHLEMTTQAFQNLIKSAP